MYYQAKDFEEYLSKLPQDRKEVIEKLIDVVRKNLPEGFEEGVGYGMIGYSVPLKTYPPGYHVTKEPLPFIGIASQKNHVAFYHMGIYMFPEIMEWFIQEYPKHVKTKLDMGKSCIRFKNTKTIPYDLLGQLLQKISLEDYIEKYEEGLKK